MTRLSPRHRAGAGLEVVGHPAHRLDVGVLRLPLHVAAVAPSLHHVHAASIVGLLVQHPPAGGTGEDSGPVGTVER